LYQDEGGNFCYLISASPVNSRLLPSASSDSEITVEEASFVHTKPPQDGSAPPVATSDTEVLHDKVKKQVIKEGHGKKPLKFATCFGKYGTNSSFHMLRMLVSTMRLSMLHCPVLYSTVTSCECCFFLHWLGIYKSHANQLVMYEKT
jgi:hypothetical protein